MIVWETLSVLSRASRSPHGLDLWEAHKVMMVHYWALEMISSTTGAISGAMMAPLLGCGRGAPSRTRWWQSLLRLLGSVLLGAAQGFTVGIIIGIMVGAEFEFLITVPLATGGGFFGALVAGLILTIRYRATTH